MALEINAETARELLEQDLANIARKAQQGRKLTASERAFLTAHATGAPSDAGSTYAHSYVELASILGVARRTMQDWRKRPDAPEPRADGKHDVMAWRVYMRRNDLAGAGSEEPTLDEEQLKLRRLLADVEDREIKVAIKKEQYIPVDVVATEWQSRVGKATALLRNKFESELPPILSGLDAAQIQAESRRAIDEVLTLLHSGNV